MQWVLVGYLFYKSSVYEPMVTGEMGWVGKGWIGGLRVT